MVQIKRKVTIKKKIAQEEVPVVNPVVTPNPTSTPTSTTKRNSSISKWIIGAVVVLGLCCAAYFLISKAKSDERLPEEGTEIISDQTNNESAAESTIATEEPTSTQDESKTDSITEQVEESEAAKEEAAPVVEQKIAATEKTSAKVQTADISSSIEENARRVIRGDFGNGQTRKDKLGDKYTEIQNFVNEMYRKGLVN